MRICQNVLLWGIMVLLISCGTPKNYTYFRNIPDSSKANLSISPTVEFKDPLVQKNDILQITILTLDPQANSILSPANTATFPTQSSNGLSATPPVQGFLVDGKGEIELPIIGKVNVLNLTTAQVRDLIHEKVAVYYKNPVINVRFVNFNITVLGEVNKPGTYTVSNEKVTLLDAIGMAGDLTVYGKRENILLVRDSSGIKQFTRFNIGSTNVLQSPYYYLKQGDVVYIEPNKTKIKSADAAIQTRNYALLASIVTVLVVIFSRI